MPASVMTMPEATRAVQMYRAGYSQPQIAATLGRSRKAVRTALRQLGVPSRTLAEAWRNQFSQAPEPAPSHAEQATAAGSVTAWHLLGPTHSEAALKGKQAGVANGGAALNESGS